MDTPQADVAEKSTYVPRFTIRALLVAMAACAVLFVVAGIAYRGQAWAWGITIGILSLGLTMLVHAACYSVVRRFARLFPPAPSREGDR